MTSRHRKKSSARAGKGLGRAESRKPASKASSRPAASGPTGGRLWAFRLIAAVGVPALVLVVAELGLRLVGYGHRPSAIIETRIDGTSYACDNSRFAWRFFPRHLAREASPYIFPETKPDNTCRIFVLGASAAMGVPEPAFSFGRMLRVMLADRYPGARFEVITTAMAAINSHVVLPIARDCARYEPDLFVVYLGNNEVTGPYGAGSVFAPLAGNLSVIRAAIAVKGTRLGQLATNLLAAMGPREGTPQMWRGLEMFVDKQVRADDPGLQAVYAHFRANLRDIIEVGRDSGAKVVLCTLGGNLKDNPPFGSLHRRDLNKTDAERWDKTYQQAVAHEEAGRYVEAVQAYLAAAEIDNTYADLQFRLGRCYWLQGEYEKAAERYAKAREMDTLRFRADNGIDKAIRDTAANDSDGVFLVDAAKAFAENSPHQVPGEELFYEHVHMNFRGTYVLACSILEQVEPALPDHIRKRKADGREPLGEQECALRLAYTDVDRYVIAEKILNDFLKRPPFSNRLYHAEQIERMERNLAALRAAVTPEAIRRAAEQCRQAVESDPEDWLGHWKYGQFLAEYARDPRAAAEQFGWVRDRLPHSWLAHQSLGVVLAALGNTDEAIALYEQALRLQPTSGRTHYYVGEQWHNRGKNNKAKKHYAEAIRWEPDCVPAYNNLAKILAAEGKHAEATEVCRRGLIFSPDSAVLHCTLGTLLARQGKRTEAIEEFRTALRFDPNSAPARESLRILLNGPK